MAEIGARRCRIFRACKQHVNLDVNFKQKLTADVIISLVEMLFKNLLHQRQQVPLRVEVLEKDLEKVKGGCQPGQETWEVPYQKDESPSCPRECARRAKNMQKNKTLQERYLRKAHSFMDDLEEKLEHLKEEILTNLEAIKCISFSFGATPFSPKEVYHIILPKTLSRHETSNASWRKRACLHLFRALVTHDTLFSMLGDPLKLTNVHVSVLKKSCSEEMAVIDQDDWLIPRPELGGIFRGKVVSFRFFHPESMAGSIRRTEYPFPLEGVECDVPIPMELCTPGPSQRKRHVSVEDTPHRYVAIDMIETPCVTRSFAPVVEEEPTPKKLSPVSTKTEELIGLLSSSEPYCWFVSQKPIKGFR